MSARHSIEDYLSCIVGAPLQYAIKRSDFDLFQLGFGECISVEMWKDQMIEINKFALHFDSAMYIYWKTGRVDRFFSNSEQSSFSSVTSELLGLFVKRIALSDKNDLWIDLEKCDVVIVTREDEEESWRFFQPRTEHPHIIASNAFLAIDGE